MNTTKKLMALLLALLALTACQESKDEPKPVICPYVKTTLYLATSGFSGYPEFIVSLEGDTIYQCEDVESKIHSLVADGSDWYVVIRRGDGVFNMLKNGESIHMTGEKLWGFTVEDGNVYTVQENLLSNTIWLCKDFERIYQVPNNAYYFTFSVDHGNVVMGVYDEKPCYWYNGEIIPIEGLNGGFDWVYGIDKKGDDMLITYQDIPTRSNMYWWKDTRYDLESWFTPKCSRIVNGKAYILGKKTTNQGVGGVDGVAAVIIDGTESILSDAVGSSAEQIVVDGDDAYILVKHGSGNYTDIYKNMEAITLPSVEIPEEYKPYHMYHDYDRCTLGELGVKCFAVVSSQK